MNDTSPFSTSAVSSTTAKAYDQDGFAKGRVVVITGSSDGIGRVASEEIAKLGAHVVMVGRNEAKTTAAAERIMSATGGRNRNVDVEIADLLLQENTRSLAERLLHKYPRIDCLINNAGALFTERKETSEGFERTFALNHLSGFTLTMLLLARIVESHYAHAKESTDVNSGAALTMHTPLLASRIINVSSRAHQFASFRGNDLEYRNGFGGWRAYQGSKLHNILFTRELASRLDPKVITVNALHPGVVSTRFATNNGARGRFLRRLMDIVSITAARGADTMVWLANSSEVEMASGNYWVNRKRKKPSRVALNESNAKTLWRISCELTNIDANDIVASCAAAIKKPSL